MTGFGGGDSERRRGRSFSIGAAGRWKITSTIAFGLILAGCGGTTPSATATPTPTTLIVSFAGFDTAFTQLYVAKINGYFDAVNLDVQIKNFGANVITGMVSGQLDLAFQGANSAMLPVRDGADTTVIYNNVGGGVSAFVYCVPKAKTISDFTRMRLTPAAAPAYCC